jgi:hypothetical protein
VEFEELSSATNELIEANNTKINNAERMLVKFKKMLFFILGLNSFLNF